LVPQLELCTYFWGRHAEVDTAAGSTVDGIYYNSAPQCMPGYVSELITYVFAAPGRVHETYYFPYEFLLAAGQYCCYCHLANFGGMLLIVHLFVFVFDALVLARSCIIAIRDWHFFS
jgi:hypothetical protein